ncbi:MAG: amidase, partial [Albidovulum sp.]
MTILQELGGGSGLAKSIAQAVRQKKVSAKEIVTDTFERVSSVDGTLNAFCALNEVGALRVAEEIDQSIARGEKVGSLAGVPVAIKDLLSTKDLKTTYGSLLYRDFLPEEDDVVVERLRAAGAIIIGKTNTSEFGYGAIGHNPVFPTTRNPWNLNLTTGGSSAGSAAAVAARIVPIGMGSDGGGSVRIPASLCGVYGIKPSLGRIPVYPGCRDARFPGISSWESLEHIGPICRSVEDAALILSAVTGPSPRDRFSMPNEIANWQIPAAETLHGARIALSLDLG